MFVPAAQLNVSSLHTSSLLLAAPGGNEAAWLMSVRPGAVRECGMLLLAQWAPCGGPPAEALAEVFLQLPEPKAVRVSGVRVSGTAAQQAWVGTSGVTLAPQGDLATLNGIDMPSSATFSVEVDFVDPVSGAESTRVFSTDIRTSFSTSNPACVTFDGRNLTVLASCGAAELSVTASVDFGGVFGTLTSNAYDVSIATYRALSLQLDVYPEGPTNVASAKWLRREECTDVYQSVQPLVTATLSTGETRTVTDHCSFRSDAPSVVSERDGIFAGKGPGTAVVWATFHGTAPPPHPPYTLAMCKNECKVPTGQDGAPLPESYYYDDFQSYGGNDGDAGACEDNTHGGEVDCDDSRYQYTDFGDRPTVRELFDDLRQCMYWCQCCAFPADGSRRRLFAVEDREPPPAASASADLTVEISPMNVTSLELTLSGSGVLYGARGTHFPSTLKAVLPNGTVYSNVHALNWMNGLVSYSSGTPSAVKTTATGVVLLDNHRSLVTVTATTTCSPLVSAADSTAPNLKVPFRGVDLGVNNALQFSASSGIVPVPVLVNAGDLGAKLTSFQIVVSFEAQLLRAVSHSEGVTAGSLATAAFTGLTVVTLNDPVWEVLINGNTDASVAPTGLVQLTTLELEMQPGAAGKITYIQATLVGLVTCSKCDGTDDNSSDGLGAEVGGSGYVILPGRRQRRLRLSPQPRPARVGRALLPDGSCCGASVGVDAYFGDINGDCVFDIKDVRRASLLLLSQSSTAVIPTEYQGMPLCPWQQQQLDPTLDGAFMPDDAVYLLLALSRKRRFVGSVTLALPTPPPQILDFQAKLFDERTNAANDRVAVRLELQYAPAFGRPSDPPSLDYELGAAEEPALSSENNLLASAEQLEWPDGSGTGVYALRTRGPDVWNSHNAWSLGAEWRVAMMVETTDSLGNSETSRSFPFFGSSATLYAAQGFRFKPFRVAVVPPG